MTLLNDTQLVLAHERTHAPSQAAMRQLRYPFMGFYLQELFFHENSYLSKIVNFREQLEDAETAKLSALKGRHTLESELNDLRMEVSNFK